MQLAITKKVEIKSKAGQAFTILHGIAEDGETVQVFMNEAQAKEFDVPEGAIATAEQLKALHADLPVVDVDFNNRGRLVGVKV